MTTALTIRRLDELAVEIRYHEEQAHNCAGEAIQHKIEIGKRLIEAKGALGKGKFGLWAAEQTGWTRSYVAKHMRLARFVSRGTQIQGSGRALMQMALSTLKALPTPPDPNAPEAQPQLVLRGVLAAPACPVDEQALEDGLALVVREITGLESTWDVRRSGR